MSQTPKARSRSGLQQKELLLCVEDDHFRFDPFTLFKLMGPGVYMANAADGNCLYIGSAVNVLARVSDPAHRSFRLALQQACGISVITAKSERHARQLEAYYISLRQPKYNVVGKGETSRTFAEHIREQAEEFSFATVFRTELIRRLA